MAPPHERLKGWLKATSTRPAQFAKRLRYDRSNFHRVLNGSLRPSLDLAHRIDIATNGAIPMSAWVDQPTERVA